MYLSAVLMVWLAGMALAAMSPVRAADIEMMRMPGSSKVIPMPPTAMRTKAEQHLRNGTGPGIVMVEPHQMEKKCNSRGYLLGCVTPLGKRMGIVFIRKGMSRELTHMAKVHEFAHYLYDWKH